MNKVSAFEMFTSDSYSYSGCLSEPHMRIIWITMYVGVAVPDNVSLRIEMA